MPGKHEFFKIFIPKKWISYHGDGVFSVRKLRHPEEYEENLKIALGKAFTNTFLQKSKAHFLSTTFLNQVGTCFIRYVNQIIDSGIHVPPFVFDELIEHLAHILNYKSYFDTDNIDEKIDIPFLKKNAKDRLKKMFLFENPLHSYYQLLSIMIHAFHLHLPRMQDFSLERWEKTYHVMHAKMENHRVSLQTFFPNMDEVFKVKNKKRMKFIYSMPFGDFKPEVLLEIAKLVKLVNTKFENNKNTCLSSIQQHLAFSSEGNRCLRIFFNKVRYSRDTDKALMKNISNCF